MLIRQPPIETEISRHTCSFHERHPGVSYAGCTCSGSYKVRVKPMKEWTEDETREYLGIPHG